MVQHSPLAHAIGAPASELDGAYSSYLDYHNYGYTLRYSGQVNVAVYNAKLMFYC